MMIYKIFKKPNLPIVLHDCLLITGDLPIPIGKVYLFTSTRSMSVREFGELWPSDIILDDRRFLGYFCCNFNPKIDTLGDYIRTYTIQSSAKFDIVYKLKEVAFSKINNSFGQDGSMLYIKFSCTSYDIIKQNRKKDE